MGLVGVPFEKWVEKQINHRQKVLGKTQRTPEELQYLSNNNSWVRIASSVNIKTEANLDIGTDHLPAENYILFGGIRSFSSLPQGGVVPNNEYDLALQSKFSYGFGSREYGYTPPPGVDSLTIRHQNRGSIRKYSIKLKAQNKDQFKIIDALYLRLGYYILVEWGHTSYFQQEENEEELTYNGSPEFNTPAFSALFNGTKNDVIRELQNQRQTTSGNYDGGLAKVDNFSWNFNADGSYDITISAVSIGGLIDSLTMNFQGPNLEAYDAKNYVIKDYTIAQKKNKIKELGYKYDENSNADKRYNDVIKQIVAQGNIQKLLDNDVLVDEEIAIGGVDLSKLVFDEFAGTIFSDQYKTALNDFLLTSVLTLKNKEVEWINSRYKKLLGGKLLAIKFESGDKKKKIRENYYMRLDYLFEYIRDNIIPFNFANEDITDEQRKNLIPQIGFEVESKMLTHWFQGSVDPYTCLIPFKYIEPENPDTPTITSVLSNILGNDFREGNDDIRIGNLEKIHVNMECVAEILRAVGQSDPEGKIRLLGFLDELLIRIQLATGDINRLSVLYDESNNTIVIQDDTQLPTGETKELPTPIRIYGVQESTPQGSFVKNMTMISQLTPNTAKEMAVGAVATGDTINNSTSLLGRWNVGFIDRLQEKDTSEGIKIEEDDNALEKLKNLYIKYYTFIKDTYENFSAPTSPDIGVATSTLKSILDYDFSVQTLNGEIGGRGFLPINLQITIDGLSGVLLYQKFSLTPNVLPPSYSEGVDFIITAIDHTLLNNEWTTTYNTQSVARFRAVETQPNQPTPPKVGHFSKFKKVFNQ